MGNGKLKPAVVDAGPIIHLKEIGCLSYLQLFPTLHIPDAVWSETVGHGRVLKEELTRLDNIQPHTLNNLDVERFIKDNGCEDLDAGERGRSGRVKRNPTTQSRQYVGSKSATRPTFLGAVKK